MKNHKIVPNKKQLKIFREGWKQFNTAYDVFWASISAIEKWMSYQTGIKDIEFFKDDMCGDWCGVGNADRTLPLIQGEALE